MMVGMTMASLSVVQSMPLWLPLTSPWLFNQVRMAPPAVRQHVSCVRKANLDQFAIPGLRCLSDHRSRSIWELGLRKLRLRRHLPFLVEVIRQTECALVHSHWGDSAWWDMHAVRRTDARHVVTFYGKDVNLVPIKDPRWRKRYRELFAHVDAVLCEGPHMAACIARLGCEEEKIRVHHLGVDVDRIRYQPRRWSGSEPLRVLIAASFREKKGIPLAITALGRLKKQIKNLEVTIIGNASDDPRSFPEKQRILEAIRDANLQDSVRMLGYQPHAVLLDEAYSHHVFLSPSLTAVDGDTEGGAPVALIDMAASGMLIVSSTHCDIPNVVIDGETGLLAQEGSLDSLFDRLCQLVDCRSAWQEMCDAGRARVEAHFSARLQAERLASLYFSFAGEPSGTPPPNR